MRGLQKKEWKKVGYPAIRCKNNWNPLQRRLLCNKIGRKLTPGLSVDARSSLLFPEDGDRLRVLNVC